MKTKLNRYAEKLSALLLVAVLAASNPYEMSAQEQMIYKRGSTTVENTLPPSPDPSSAVRYVDVPFNHSQGIAEYDVPVYTLQGRELKIPIGLRYSSGGIRMDEVAGVAGLGWTLEAGGVITRTVVDMPDEFSAAGFRHQMPSSSLLSKLENQTNDNETMNYLRDIVWHRLDSSLDRYRYSVCGLSGTFVIDGNGEVRQLSGEGVSISFTPGDAKGANSFTITGPDGTVYTFDAKETGTHDGSEDHPFTPTGGEPDRWEAYTAWHLTSVTSRSGLESASLTYSQSADWTRNVRSRREVLSVSKSASGAETSSTSPEFSYVACSYSVPVLTSIELSGYTASFTYAQDTGNSFHYVATGQSSRNHPFRLTDIVISHAGTSISSMSVGTGKSPYDGRIVLNSLRLYKGSVLDDRWDFSYDTRTYQVSRYSQDWFGFYNGEDDASPHSRGGVSPFTFAPSTHTVTLSNGFPDATKASYMSLVCANHDGASTRFSYEGNTISVPGAGVSSVSIGIRVRQVTVLDNDFRVSHVRTFTYEDPQADGPTFPVPALYTTTSASLSDAFSPSGIVSLYHNWTISLHEHTISHDPSVSDARVSYGRVTEDVTGEISVRPIRPTPSQRTSVARTVRCYSLEGIRGAYTATISRFPSYWSTDYTSLQTIPSGVDPMTGIRQGYMDSGPAASALLTSIDEYTSEDGSSFSHLTRTEYSYDAGARTAILTDYSAVQVMQRLEYGNLQYQDIYHYPVYATAYTGRHPVSERRIEYHADGGSDEYTIATSYVTRSGLDVPVRPESVSMTEGGHTRMVSYVYPDTVSPSTWSTALRQQHDLTTVLRKDYREWDGFGPAAVSKSISSEYALFAIGSRNVYLPKRALEQTDGVESWREEVKTRDILGNVSSVKSTGEPETVIIWSWNGLYPMAVVSNAQMQDVVSCIGSQVTINSIAQSSGPSLSQILTVDNLRMASLLSGAHVSTYTWAPGRGLTSETDPAGLKSTYEYDSHGRLACIKDNDGNRTEGYSYSLLNDGGDGRLSVTSRKYRNSSGSSYAEDVRWFNTLGMTIEDIEISGSGDGRDLVTAHEGDFLGHDDVKTWLPYPVTGSGGAFQSNAGSAASTYHANTLAYWSKRYESSSRDRVIASAAPGFAGTHETSHGFGAAPSLPRYVWGATGIAQSGTWSASELQKETTTSADGQVSYTIKDHSGRTIATGSGNNDRTFYVYDVKDRLRAVIGGGISVADTLNAWRYSYDSKGRLSSKGIPGSSTRESYSYDSENRVKYRYHGTECSEYEYDSFGRQTKLYFKKGSASRVLQDQSVYDAYPGEATPLIRAATGLASWSGPAKGLKTYELSVETNSSDASNGSVKRVWLYDSKERPVWIVTQYQDGSYLKENLTYSFSGEVISDVVTYTNGSIVDVLSTSSSYDVRGRQASSSSTLTSSGSVKASLTSQYSYDSMGRPSGRSTVVNGGITLASADTYTLQQWLSSHSVSRNGAVLYTETLGYDGPAAFSDVTPLYSGLISKRTDSMSGYPGRTVGYGYDASGRLVREHSGSVNASYSYDSRGNILNVNRGSAGTDTYSYSGDRIGSLTRTGLGTVSFTHDSFGRMTYDGLEGVTMQYNHMDLPGKIQSGGTTLVNYTYLSDGTKTSALKSNGEGLVYRGPFTYRKSAGGSLSLESATCAEGRLTVSGAMLHVTDHLGSVVAVVRGSDGALYEASEYDAYGKRSSLTSSSLPSGVTLRDRFTGKEDQGPDFGFGYTDFGARQLSSSTRRWMVPDPLSEKYYGISPYAYCAGDPVNMVDPDGRVLSTHTDKDGFVVATFNDGDLGIYMHEGSGREAFDDVNRNYSSSNTSAGGSFMGYSLHADSFDKEFANNRKKELGWIQIDFNSTELEDRVNSIMRSRPSIYEYIKKARTGKDWDLKTKIDNGSILYDGIYASPRDAGNFLAGMYAGSKGVLSEPIMYGYGVYNLTKNNLFKTVEYSIANLMAPPLESSIMYLYARYRGEHPLSRLGQELGLKHYRRHEE